MQAHYDEGQRQLAVTLDQLAIAQRKIQSLTGEIEELRGNYDAVITNYLPDCFQQDLYNRDFFTRFRHCATNVKLNNCTKNRRAVLTN